MSTHPSSATKKTFFPPAYSNPRHYADVVWAATPSSTGAEERDGEWGGVHPAVVNHHLCEQDRASSAAGECTAEREKVPMTYSTTSAAPACEEDKTASLADKCMVQRLTDARRCGGARSPTAAEASLHRSNSTSGTSEVVPQARRHSNGEEHEKSGGAACIPVISATADRRSRGRRPEQYGYRVLNANATSTLRDGEEANSHCSVSEPSQHVFKELLEVQEFLHLHEFDVGGPYADLFMVLLSAVRTVVDAATGILQAEGRKFAPLQSATAPTSSSFDRGAEGVAAQDPLTAKEPPSLSQPEEVRRPPLAPQDNSSTAETDVSCSSAERNAELLQKSHQRSEELKNPSLDSSTPQEERLAQRFRCYEQQHAEVASDLQAQLRAVQQQCSQLRVENTILMQALQRMEQSQRDAPAGLVPEVLKALSTPPPTLEGTRSISKEQRVGEVKMKPSSFSSSSPRASRRVQGLGSIPWTPPSSCSASSHGMRTRHEDPAAGSHTPEEKGFDRDHRTPPYAPPMQPELVALQYRVDVLEAFTPTSLPRLRARLPFLGFEVLSSGPSSSGSAGVPPHTGRVPRCKEGLVVTRVDPGYAPHLQGLRVGDILCSLNQVPLLSFNHSLSAASEEESQALSSATSAALSFYLLLDDLLREDRAKRVALLQSYATRGDAATAPLCGSREGERSVSPHHQLPHRDDAAAPEGGVDTTWEVQAAVARAFQAPCVLRLEVLPHAKHRHDVTEANPENLRRSGADTKTSKESNQSSMWVLRLEVPNPPRAS